MMGKKKVFPRADLGVPSVPHSRDAGGRISVRREAIAAATSVVHFPEVRNSSGYRSFDFGRWYGKGFDDIAFSCQRQIERYLATHDGDLSVTTVVNYCKSGLRTFLDYLSLRCDAEGRALTLDDIDRDLIDGYVSFLGASGTSANTQRMCYQGTKSVLVALGHRGLVRLAEVGDDATFSKNLFPHTNRNARGEAPLPRAQRQAFTAAVRTAVMPLMKDEVEPTSDLLAYALLVIALHTGRNSTPLLELSIDCLRAHPKEGLQFLVVYKRRGNNSSKVALRSERSGEETPTVFPTVARLVRRVIELTANLRHEAPIHLRTRIWLYRSQSNKDRGAILVLSNAMLKMATQRLVESAGLIDTDGRPLRINVSRLRKTFINRVNEILGDDLVTTAAAAGNTPQVTASSYLRPGEDARKNWKFMGMMLTRELLSATLGTSEKTPAGHCTDNKQGQYAPKKEGAVCMNFLDCLRCRNYVVTGDDLYRLFSFYFRIYRERSMVGRQVWARRYRHIVRLIERDVIDKGIESKVFGRSTVDAARARARTDPHPYWEADGVLEVSR